MGAKTINTNNSQANSWTPYAYPEYANQLSRTIRIGSKPYTPYTGQLVAPMNATQNAAGQNINNTYGMLNNTYGNLQSTYNQAGNVGQTFGNLAGQAVNAGNDLSAQNFSSTIGSYMNPYIQSVINPTMANINTQNSLQDQGVIGSAIQAGNAFGGDRMGLGLSALANQQDLAAQQTIANLYSSGFGAASGLEQANAQQQLAGLSTAGNLTAGQLQAAATQNQSSALALGAAGQQLQTGEAQLGYGTLQQQTKQAQDTANYQQFQNKIAFPYQQASWLNQNLTGLGSQMGGMGQGSGSATVPNGNFGSTILGAGLAGSALYNSGALNGIGSGLSSLFGGGTAASTAGIVDLSGSGAAAAGALTLLARGGAIKGYAGGGNLASPSPIPIMPVPSANIGSDTTALMDMGAAGLINTPSPAKRGGAIRGYDNGGAPMPYDIALGQQGPQGGPGSNAQWLIPPNLGAPQALGPPRLPEQSIPSGAASTNYGNYGLSLNDMTALSNAFGLGKTKTSPTPTGSASGGRVGHFAAGGQTPTQAAAASAPATPPAPSYGTPGVPYPVYNQMGAVGRYTPVTWEMPNSQTQVTSWNGLGTSAWVPPAPPTTTSGTSGTTPAPGSTAPGAAPSNAPSSPSVPLAPSTLAMLRNMARAPSAQGPQTPTPGVAARGGAIRGYADGGSPDDLPIDFSGGLGGPTAPLGPGDWGYTPPPVAQTGTFASAPANDNSNWEPSFNTATGTNGMAPVFSGSTYNYPLTDPGTLLPERNADGRVQIGNNLGAASSVPAMTPFVSPYAPASVDPSLMGSFGGVAPNGDVSPTAFAGNVAQTGNMGVDPTLLSQGAVPSFGNVVPRVSPPLSAPIGPVVVGRDDRAFQTPAQFNAAQAPTFTPGARATASLGSAPFANTPTIPQRLISDLQRDYGLTQAQATGAVGWMGYETGGFNQLQELPSKYNNYGAQAGGYGYAQWTGPRRTAFMQYARANGLDPSSYEANYGFLKQELASDPYKGVIPALKQTNSVKEASDVWGHQYEGMTPGGPGVPAFAQHAAVAQAYADGDFRGTSPSLSASPAVQAINRNAGPASGTFAASPAPGNLGAPPSANTMSAQATPAQSQQGFLDRMGIHLTPAQNQALLAAGLGMMASRSNHLGQAIGEGGLAGIGQYMSNQRLGLEQQNVGSEVGLRNAQAQGILTENQLKQQQLAIQRAALKQMGLDIGAQPYTPSPTAAPADVASGLASEIAKTAKGQDTQSAPQSPQAPTPTAPPVAQKAPTIAPGWDPDQLYRQSQMAAWAGNASAAEQYRNQAAEIVKSGIVKMSDGSWAPLPGIAGAAARKNAIVSTPGGPIDISTGKPVTPVLGGSGGPEQGSVPPSAPPQAPQGAPGAVAGPSAQVPYRFEVPVPEGTGPDSMAYTELGQKALAAQGDEVVKGAYTAGQAGQKQKALLGELMSDYASMPSDSFLASGAGGEWRLQFARTANTLAALAGQKQRFDPDQIASAEQVNKIVTQLGVSVNKGLGREPGYILEKLSMMQPGLENTPQGNKLIMGGQMATSQSDIDFENFLPKYMAATGGSVRGADVAFNRMMPPDRYVHEAQVLASIPKRSIDLLRSDPAKGQEFDQRYGPGMARYFIQ